MTKPVKVLVVGMTATVGGIENFLMAHCGRMDPKRVQFDFLTRFEQAAYARERNAIGRTYVIPCRSEDPVRFYQEIRAFFKAHAAEYDIIWDNECMFNDMTPLMLAEEYGIPVRIAHSHNPQNMDVSLRGRAQELLHRLQRRRLGRWANVLWACSEASARWVCPRMDLPCSIIPNAVRARDFRFDAKVRQEVRAHYGLEGCLVVGHVGRLQYQKNQTFLLTAFARLKQREPRARLVLVGDGPDLTDLEARAVDLGIAQDVLFLGVRDDVPRLMQAFDLFVMPSHFEGLGMAALEAQAAGLPCLLSDTVPQAAAVTQDVYFLPPEDPDVWSERMMDLLEEYQDRERPDTMQQLADAGYEIGAAAEALCCRFEQLKERSASFRRRFILTMPTRAEGVPAMNKARGDVLRFAMQADYVPLQIKAADSARGDRWQQVKLLAAVVMDWTRLFFRLRHGDILLMQYPYFPVKGAAIARFGMHMLQWKGVRIAALVHDLDSLRCIGGDAARWSDQELLPKFDRIICHNQRMLDYLAAQGYDQEKLIDLELFDYACEGDAPRRQMALSVCVAGNLSKRKAAYLQQLPRSQVTWHLYGPGWKDKKNRGDLIWHGEQAADGLPDQLEGAFGLVWDGTSLDGCSGVYGSYLMLNNPHKASLYLAAGMPLVVWRWSALASLVQQEGVGLVIDRIGEIQSRLQAVTPEAYEAMAENARRIGAQLRRGGKTKQALAQLERI